MRRWLGLVVLCVLLAGTVPAGVAASDEAAREAALRYFEAMGYDEVMEEALELMATQVPEEYREDFTSYFGAYMTEKYKPGMADLLVKHFTPEELVAMAEFYESDMGRSIADKMVPFTMDTMQYNEQQIMRMVVSFLEAHPELMEENP